MEEASILNGESPFTADFDEFDLCQFQNDLGLEKAEPFGYSSCSSFSTTPSKVTLSSLNSFDAENKKLFNLEYFEGGSPDPIIDVTNDCDTKVKSNFRSPSPMSMTASVSGSEPYSLSSPNHSEMDETDFLEYIMQETDIQVKDEEHEEQEEATPTGSSNPRRRSVPRSSSGKSSSIRGINHQSGPWCKTKNRNGSKNAVAARENRQRKKQYIQSLEEINSKLSEKNSWLKKESGEMKKKVCSLEEEVGYLRKVLYNQSALAGLLKKMNQSDVRLSTNFKAEEIQEGGGASTSSSSGGVCVHVNGDDTILKFCASCAKKDKP